MQKARRKIGFLIFEQCNALDVTGPLETFASVKDIGTEHYELVVIGPDSGLFTTESGLKLHADYAIADDMPLDTLVIPGGAGTRDKRIQQQLVPWLIEQKSKVRRMISVCTGAFLLAETGLLDNKSATTHWAHTQAFESRYPSVNTNTDALFINHGDVASSAGITAGIDLALEMIEADLGSEVSSQVARYLVVHHRRTGDQAQYSEPLQFQVKADSKFSALTGWILNHLQTDLSVAAMAEQCGMSERNFCRRFKQQMGIPPAAYVSLLRLDYARQLLVDKDWSIKRVAQACGYDHVDVFRRAFERRFSVTPKSYRLNFAH